MLSTDPKPSSHSSKAYPPLSGRKDELQLLFDHLSETLSGRGRVVLIGGEAGIGKTRLVEELVNAAILSGCEVRTGHCLPGASYAYLPLKEAFGPQGIREVVTPVTKETDIDLEADLENVFNNFDRWERSYDYAQGQAIAEQLFFNVLRALEVRSSGRPVIIRMEDLHWCDTSSLNLLKSLSRRIYGSRIMILGTYRSEELMDRGGAPHPLQAILRMVPNERLGSVLELKPLSEAQIAATLEGVLGSRVQENLTSRVFKESGGNPFFAVEMAELLATSRNIRLIGGEWTPLEWASVTIPTSVKELLMRRIDGLPSNARKVLEVASVVGDSFDPDALVGILKIDRLGLLEVFEQLDSRYQFIARDGEHYCFRHEKLKQVLYENIAPLRRRELHAQIGKAIEAKDGVKLTNNLAYHFYYGGVWDKCFQYSMLAGEDLLRKFSTWEAVQYYGYALEAQRNGGADEVQKLKALKGLADAYEECLEFEKADEIYRTLEPLMKGEDLAKVLQKRASCWTPQRLGNGDLSMLRGLIERAEKIQEVDPLFRATLMCDKASLYCLEGRPEARDLYLNALQTYLKNKLYALYAWEMLENVVKMDLSEVRLDEARREIEEVESLMKDIPWTILRLTLNKVKGQYLLLKGDTAGCLEACTRSLEQAVHYGDHYDAGTACLFMAWAMEASGDIEGMRRFAENGIKHALQCGSKGLIAVLEVQLLHAAVRRLDGAEAARARKVIKDQSIEYDSTIRTYLNGLIGVADAEMEMLAGNSSDGIIRFKNAIKMFEGVQNGLFHEALARRWFAEDLASEGLIEEAIAEFSKASTIYSKMGNKDVVVRVEKTIKML